MVVRSSMPRRTTVSRQWSSRYGNSAAIPGTTGWMSQSIGAASVMIQSTRYLHQQIVALGLDRIDRDILVRRRRHGFARTDIELGGVQRALDAAVLQPAVRQQSVLVR